MPLFLPAMPFILWRSCGAGSRRSRASTRSPTRLMVCGHSCCRAPRSRATSGNSASLHSCLIDDRPALGQRAALARRRVAAGTRRSSRFRPHSPRRFIPLDVIPRVVYRYAAPASDFLCPLGCPVGPGPRVSGRTCPRCGPPRRAGCRVHGRSRSPPPSGQQEPALGSAAELGLASHQRGH